jgi:hypothetical protein
LKYRSMPDTCIGEQYWHCEICGEWKTSDLILALESVEYPDIVTLSECE